MGRSSFDMWRVSVKWKVSSDGTVPKEKFLLLHDLVMLPSDINCLSDVSPERPNDEQQMITFKSKANE